MAEGKEVYTDKDGDDGETANLGFSGPQGFDNLNYVSSDLKQQQQQQGGKSPLGLKLTRTPAFINLLEQERMKSTNSNYTNASANSNTKKMKMTNEGGKNITGSSSGEIESPPAEKLKASNFPVKSLTIGTWKRSSKNEGELVAKCYYAKRKLVWEVLNGSLKSKIEIYWSDIVGIRATIGHNEDEILEIELNHAPRFYRETNPQPRKHTVWLAASDFTTGQALKCRRHTATFRPGYLDKNYEKLLQCDQILAVLSNRPFPTQQYPYFPDMYDSFGFGGYAHQSRIPSFNMRVSHGHSSNVPLAVMDGQYIDQDQRMQLNQGLGINGFVSRENESGMSDFDLTGERFNPNTRILPNHVENHSQVPYSSSEIAQFIGNHSQAISSNGITLYENTSAVVTNIGCQPHAITNSPNINNLGNNVGYQPEKITDFRNIYPISSANHISVGNNIGYQPNHTITNFGVSTVPPIENNMEYQTHGDGDGDGEVYRQLLYASTYENQVSPQQFRDYGLPYQHQLPLQPGQEYKNQPSTAAPTDANKPCQGYKNPVPLSTETNSTVLDASEWYQAHKNQLSSVVTNSTALDVIEYDEDIDNLALDGIEDAVGIGKL